MRRGNGGQGCCHTILVCLYLAVSGMACYATFYLRHWLSMALLWTLDSMPMILLYNIIMANILVFGLIGLSLVIEFEGSFTLQIFFKMVSFAKRDELQAIGFYGENNLQRGTYMVYPANIEEYQKLSNESFKTISKMMFVLFTAVSLNVILSLIPDNRYLIKPVFHVASVMIVMMSHAELHLVKWYDMEIIQKIADEPEFDDELEDEINNRRQRRGRRRNRNEVENVQDNIDIHMPIVPANQVLYNALDIPNRNNEVHEEENPFANIEPLAPIFENIQPNPRPAALREINPRQANRQAVRRRVRRRQNNHNNLAYYPKRHGHEQANRATTVSFTFMSSFAVYLSLLITGMAIAHVIGIV